MRCNDCGKEFPDKEFECWFPRAGQKIVYWVRYCKKCISQRRLNRQPKRKQNSWYAMVLEKQNLTLVEDCWGITTKKKTK